jgi:signal transduction histidine kinase
VGALEAQGNRLAAGRDGRRGPDFGIAAGALPDLPAAVEVAAYRIASEAMTNAARHADASRCDIELHVDHDQAGREVLTLVVSDDGAGIDGAPTAGVGLASMRERADELGGTCVVERRHRGTSVVAELPLEPA